MIISQIQVIEEACADYKETNQQYPTSLDVLVQGNYIFEENANDHWGNQIRLEFSGDTTPVITSAGPDGIFDTEDDLPTNSQ